MVDKTILPKVLLYSTIYYQGILTKSPKGDSAEIKVTKIPIYEPFPDKKLKIGYKTSEVKLRSEVSQRLLTKCYQMLMTIRADVILELQLISRVLGLIRVFSPFITFSDCEGGGETFEIKSSLKGFFKRTAYLTVSGQVDEETATSRMLAPTYILGPSFRSDPSQTPFHACEFWHYEPEVPIPPDRLDDSLGFLMDLEETIVTKLIQYVLSPGVVERIQLLHKHFKKVKVTIDQMKEFVKTPFARVSYTDSIKILIKKTELFKVKPYWGMDMGKEHERYLCEQHFKKPTFVYGYPSSFKSFYMLQSDPFIDKEITTKLVSPDEEYKLQDGYPLLQTCQGVDLLIPGVGELCGGSIREHRYEVLLRNMKKKGLDPEEYKEYLSLREEGTFPHGGFGLGFERFLMMVTSAPHIRDLTLFPRYYKCSGP